MKIAFLWSHFAMYHLDRLEALAEALEGRAAVLGLEVANASETYAWGDSGDGKRARKVTLFPGAVADRIPQLRRARAVVRAARAAGVTHLFVSGYERPGYLLAALAMRLTGSRVFVMLDSKFDDKPRRLSLELLKRLLMLPYHGGFAAGPRAADYLRFLGLRRRPVTTGYDSVSLSRLRALAPARRGAWETAEFLAVARFVEKKNLSLALAAYARFRAAEPDSPRGLHLCGGGELEPRLRAEAAALGIAAHVRFTGFASQADVAGFMAEALCLLLPSREEQWGLVVNEALAHALPLLVSENVGARDTLVRNLENGFVLDPDAVDGWATAMRLLASDRDLWQRMHDAAAARAPLADTHAFVEGVTALIGQPVTTRDSRLAKAT